MRVYVSGKITGLELEKAKEKFASAEQLISSIGLAPVNPMKNGLPESSTWEQHMLKDIAMLFECDAILMLSNWTESLGARIERAIALEMGKMILYEGDVASSACKVNLIKRAITEATGLKFRDYVSQCRKPELYFARLILVKHCMDEGVSLHNISRLINRPRNTLVRYPGEYEDEMKHNKKFQGIAVKVQNILSEIVSQ